MKTKGRLGKKVEAEQHEREALLGAEDDMAAEKLLDTALTADDGPAAEAVEALLTGVGV